MIINRISVAVLNYLNMKVLLINLSKVIGEREVSDLDDKPFVRKRRIRNRTVTLMYCNFFTGFVISMSFVSNLLILILS